MHRLRRYVLLLGLIGCLSGLLLALPLSASAYVLEPVVDQNIPAVSQHAARGGATAVPGVDCGPACQEWFTKEGRPLPNNVSSEKLHRELRTIRMSTKVLPPLRVLGTFGLAVGVFDLGWKIGTGINTKFLKIGVPDASPAGQSWQWHRVTWRTARSGSYFGASWPAEDSWVVSLKQTCCWYDEREWWFSPPCSLTGFTPPAPFVIGSASSTARCTSGSPPLTVYWGAAGENALAARGPIEDFTTQAFTRTTTAWDDKPADGSQLETRVRAQLESGNYPSYEAWAAERLDPTNHDEATEQDRDDCEFPHGGEDPGTGRGTREPGQGSGSEEEYQARYELAPGSVFPTGGVSTTSGQVYLRWGFASPNLDNQIIDWRGWGYRKIAAKHGWGAEDQTRTIEALQATGTHEGGPSDRWRYRGPPRSGRNGATCERLVVVAQERDVREVQYGAPSSRGIVTSFEQRVN